MAAQPPRPKLPPLTALRAFETAGRLGGFAPAAQELGVSPGAVTAHLKTLEAALGVTLFERLPRGVRLTETGARVLPEFTAAFAALETAVHHLQNAAAPDRVRIATTSDLAQLWLSPRLPALRAEGLQVVPMTSADPGGARAMADLALTMGAGKGALVAVAAPLVAAGVGTPTNLDPMGCLSFAGPDGDWAKWAAAAGIAGFQPRGPVHATAALALEEAANGAGVLVIAQAFAETALVAGRVVALFGVEAPTDRMPTLTRLREISAGSAADRVLSALSS